jgi:hypothetical protein
VQVTSQENGSRKGPEHNSISFQQRYKWFNYVQTIIWEEQICPVMPIPVDFKRIQRKYLGWLLQLQNWNDDRYLINNDHIKCRPFDKHANGDEQTPYISTDSIKPVVNVFGKEIAINSYRKVSCTGIANSQSSFVSTLT